MELTLKFCFWVKLNETRMDNTSSWVLFFVYRMAREIEFNELENMKSESLKTFRVQEWSLEICTDAYYISPISKSPIIGGFCESFENQFFFCGCCGLHKMSDSSLKCVHVISLFTFILKIAFNVLFLMPPAASLQLHSVLSYSSFTEIFFDQKWWKIAFCRVMIIISKAPTGSPSEVFFSFDPILMQNLISFPNMSSVF